MKKFYQLCLATLLAISTQLAVAGMPDYYPEFFPHSGTVDRLDISERYVVINDAMFRLSDNVRFHTPQSEFDVLRNLKLGDRVGCRYEKDGRGRFIVTDIWLLPDGVMPLPKLKR